MEAGKREGVEDNTQTNGLASGTIPEIGGKNKRRRRLEGLTTTFGCGHGQSEIPVVRRQLAP